MPRDINPNSLHQISLSVGKHASYLSVIKSTDSVRWDYIMNLGSTVRESATAYVDDIKRTISKIKEIHYELLKTYGALIEFSRHLHSVGIYQHTDSFASMLGGDSKLGKLQHRHYIKYKLIIEEYENGE